MGLSVFVEQREGDLACYINGDLQFDTADEAIYHEHLVVPAIALVAQRFTREALRVLVCGGGDGLAVRDVLRFAAVTEVTLVDYSPEMIELARSQFVPFNQGSLLSDPSLPLGADRVTVQTQEALTFLESLPDRCYHAVICDFTYPTTAQEADIYSQQWFEQVKRVLIPGGVMATNGVSPSQRSQGFWCLYQTMLAAGLQVKPMRTVIPSFQRHGYGDWGFFLGSDRAIAAEEVAAIALPMGLRGLDETWVSALQFPAEIAALRHDVFIHRRESSQLFYYLLNPDPLELAENDASEATIDFLTIQEPGTHHINDRDPLQLEALVQQWLTELQRPNPNLEALVPVQHRYHSPAMTQEWLSYVRSLLTQIDLNQLLPKLLERMQDLPPKVVQELQDIFEKLRKGEPITYFSDHAAELMAVITVTLLMANLVTPDAVFAKGYYSSGSSRSSSGASSVPLRCDPVAATPGATGAVPHSVPPTGSTCPTGTVPVYPESSNDGGNFGWVGLTMLIGGGGWLWKTIRQSRR